MHGRAHLLVALSTIALLPGLTATAQTMPPPQVARGAPALSASEERISDLVQIWYFTRLFHPDLTAPEAGWNAALAAAVEPARNAADDAAFVAVVDAMLAKAGDSRAYSLAAPAAPAASAAAAPQPFRVVDNVAVVDCTGIAAARVANKSLKDAIAAIEPVEEKGIVLDCRHFAPESESGKRYLERLHSEEWARRLIVARPRPAPGGFRRVRFHDGYPPETGTTSGGYENGVADIALPPLPGRPLSGKSRLTFLFDATTPAELFPLAGAAQSAGLARVVMEGSEAASERYPLRLRHVRVAVLAARYIYPDGRQGFRPDACVASGDTAAGLARAIALLDPAKPAGGCSEPAPRVTPQPDPPADAAGTAFPLPSTGERVLALAKLWGALSYFNPYKTLLDRPWDEQLDRFVGAFLAADTRAAYEAALQRLAHATDDTHVGVRGLESDAQRFAPPLYIRPVGKGWAVAGFHDPAKATGVAIGDELVSVDGRPVAEIFAEARALTAASTPQSAAGILSSYLTSGPKDSLARLGLKRGNAALEVSVPRTMAFREARRKPEDKSPAWRRLESGIGYIDLERLARADADKAIDELLDTKAIVFDLRGYPQGTAWVIAPRLAPDDAPRVAALFRRPQYRGVAMPMSQFTSFEQELPPTAKPRYKGRVVVMIDDRAISQSEHTALFFKAATNPIFVGTPTTGANGDVTTITLPGNLGVSFTGHSVRFPDGRQLQRVGIQPDIVVAPTLAGMRAGRDEVLEAALKAARTPPKR